MQWLRGWGQGENNDDYSSARTVPGQSIRCLFAGCKKLFSTGAGGLKIEPRPVELFPVAAITHVGQQRFN